MLLCKTHRDKNQTTVQIWSSVEGYKQRDPRIETIGSEPGLFSLWKFDEGRGTVTVDAASWRSAERGGITHFGVVSPAVVAAAPFSSALSAAGTANAGGGAKKVPGHPDALAATWAVSTAPVGVLARSYDGRPFSVRVHGTDAHVRRPLQAVLTRVPSGGTLSVAAPLGQSSSTASVEGPEEKLTVAILAVNDAMPVGTRLVYQPDKGAHDPWLEGTVGEYGGGGVDDWAAEGEPYDWFGYRVETEGGGEISENEAVVGLSVRPALNTAHLSWLLKVGPPFERGSMSRD